jgi:hypothetical protein
VPFPVPPSCRETIALSNSPGNMALYINCSGRGAYITLGRLQICNFISVYVLNESQVRLLRLMEKPAERPDDLVPIIDTARHSSDPILLWEPDR